MSFYCVEYFQKRRKEMEEVFNVIKPDLQELADYFLPRSVQFIARNSRKPIVKNKKIIDSTPLIALRNFSSGMMSGATSPTNRWFKTTFSNVDLATFCFLYYNGFVRCCQSFRLSMSNFSLAGCSHML